MEEDDKGCLMIRMGVSGWMFLLVPAHSGSPRQKAVKRLCVCSCTYFWKQLIHYHDISVLLGPVRRFYYLRTCPIKVWPKGIVFDARLCFQVAQSSHTLLSSEHICYRYFIEYAPWSGAIWQCWEIFAEVHGHMSVIVSTVVFKHMYKAKSPVIITLMVFCIHFCTMYNTKLCA